MKGKIEPKCVLHRGIFKLGFYGVTIFDKRYERAVWNNTGTLILHGSINLSSGFRLANHGVLEIGDGFSITANSSIICMKNIRIGNNVLISWDVSIMDYDFHGIYDLSKNKLLNSPEKIEIGDNVWISSRCMITKGASIPNNSVIAANSKISKKINTSNILIGDNGKILKEGIYWTREYILE